jgi:nitrilase
MANTRLAGLGGHFGRDIDRALSKLEVIIAKAKADGIVLLVLPDACLGGYISDVRDGDADDLPPAVATDGPELAAVAAMAGDLTVCVGYTELSGELRYNAAACVTGDGVIGSHRKVHQPAGESPAYAAGHTFTAFDSPVGRIGMLIDYDKTFPESARTLAVDGARILAVLSAWPATVADRAERLNQDPQSRLFDLYDSARAAENQVVLVSSNQTGMQDGVRFLGQAKVVGPGGDVLARTGAKGGLAVADIDVDREVERARRVLRHLAERRVDTYHNLMQGSRL